MSQNGLGEPFPLVVDQGATFRKVFRYSQYVAGVKTPVDLTGYSARMMVRTTYTAASPTISLTSPSGGITISAAAGEITVVMTATQTAAIAAGRYVYDLEIESGGGEVTRIADGPLTVTPEVTR